MEFASIRAFTSIEDVARTLNTFIGKPVEVDWATRSPFGHRYHYEGILLLVNNPDAERINILIKVSKDLTSTSQRMRKGEEVSETLYLRNPGWSCTRDHNGITFCQGSATYDKGPLQDGEPYHYIRLGTKNSL